MLHINKCLKKLMKNTGNIRKERKVETKVDYYVEKTSWRIQGDVPG